MGNELSHRSRSISLRNLSARVPRVTFLNRRKLRKILILSLDAAGKTSILYRLKTGNLINTIPTIGYNHETIQYKSSNFDFWDLGGQDGIRKLWSVYFQNVQGIVFVIDSNDRERIAEASEELKRIQQLLFTGGHSKAVILILANKQDLPDVMSFQEVYDSLKVQEINKSFRCELITCCTKNGVGLEDALQWLHRELKSRF